ncbi:hypothetical protein SAY86_031757 [Trapa natans]|uniref:Uncharacterized protein n=1 Tax=Trapa natans TaxID=22666 RepID=A0AAN7R3T9_TRANT|nr:hypothetical protein SAY86_031757 [Trapa natans]
MTEFLLDKGSDIDKPDIHGWTPRDLAEQQGHEHIKELFKTRRKTSATPVVGIPPLTHMLDQFSSNRTIRPASERDRIVAARPMRRTKDCFQNWHVLTIEDGERERESRNWHDLEGKLCAATSQDVVYCHFLMVSSV